MKKDEILERLGQFKSISDDKKDREAARMLRKKPVEYNKEVLKNKSAGKAAAEITRRVQDEIKTQIGKIEPEKPIAKNLQIDLWDGDERIAYEVILGNGHEIYRDIMKALIARARKLVVFCRSYPNPRGNDGYTYINNQYTQIREYLDRQKLDVEIINFMD